MAEPQCPACREPLSCRDPGAVCPDCQRLWLAARPAAPIEGLPHMHALWDYSGTVRSLIGAAKDASNGPQSWSLWRAALPHLRADRAIFEACAFIPAPSSRMRTGFSLPRVLSQRLAAEFHGQSLPLLRHRVPRPPQSTLNGPERRANLRGALALRRSFGRAVPRPRTGTAGLWLVDDVATTGATLEECARTLHAAGWGPLAALVLARVP